MSIPFFIPPRLEAKATKSPLNNKASEEIRSQRFIDGSAGSASESTDRRLTLAQLSMYNAENGLTLPGKPVGSSFYETVDSKQFDYMVMWSIIDNLVQFLKEVMGYTHPPIIATLRYRRNYNNAFWDGQRIVFGTGDSRIFSNFCADPTAVAHELGHSMVSKVNPSLRYSQQAAAIHEHLADVIAICFMQWMHRENSTSGRWLIGEVCMTGPYALRNMREPGQAFRNHPQLGNDTQIGSYRNYSPSIDPHDASGIANKAFSAFAIAVGGLTFDLPLTVWWAAVPKLPRDCTFLQFANSTVMALREHFRNHPNSAAGSYESKLVLAWKSVGVL